MRISYGFFKRFIDITISLVGIVFVLSWLIPLVGLLIILDSKGPVFFVQSRDGLKGRRFNCLKFRTMRPNFAAHLVQARKNDDRITRIGAFLRKSHIDELPQFINIFLGQMSFIGPRPHMHRDTVHYSSLVNNYYKRLEVKPGFTGLAQINDLCGNTSDVASMAKRVRLDNFYVDHQSLALDMHIILMSVRVALRKVNTFLNAVRPEHPEPEVLMRRRLRKAA